MASKRAVREELRAKYAEFLPRPFPEAGYTFDGYPEYDEAISGLVTQVIAGETIEAGDLPSLPPETEAALARYLAGDQPGVEDLRRNEQAVGELRALLLEAISASNESARG
jgi:hypothetical protein